MRRLLIGLICMTAIAWVFFFGDAIVEASAPDFSVQAVLPESQSNENVSYFDLTLAPNQEEILPIQVTNNSNEEIILELSANTATTNSNGDIY
ncbi:WxL protein peptidoglycan domain-containing protein, partial [Enterococcus entomosocium]